MAERQLIVRIIGDDASLQRALGSSGAATAGFGDRAMAAGQKISSVGKTLTTHLTLPLLAVGAVAGKAAVDFQNSMELLHTQAGVSQDAVDKLSKSVLALAGPTATAPDQLSAGLYHLASQGLRGKDALDALKASAEGAKLGQANLEDVTNALGAVIVSKIGGVKSYGQAMGEMNKIVGSGDMRMQDLAAAMGTGLPAAAKIAGVSLDQVGGALATFGDNNIRGAKAGTLLNSTLRIMASPSAAAQKALAGVGISATQLGDSLRSHGLVGAVQLLKDKMDAAGLSATQQGILLTAAFGGRQATGVKILIDELDRLKTKTAEVGKGGGQFASDWEAYTKTTAYHLASMGAQMQATGVTIGTVLLPVVAKIADVIGSLAAKFENLSPGVQKAILIFGGVAAAIGPVIGVIGSLTTALGFLAANPIVLVIAGIAALAAAIAAAVIWPDKLKSVLEKMGLSAHAAGEVVGGLRDVFRVVKEAGEDLVAAIRDHWATISAIISGAVDIVKSVIRVAVAIIEGVWSTFGGTLTSIVETTFGYIAGTIRNDLTIIRGIIDVITGLIHGDWSKVWKGLQEIVGGVFDQIKNIIHMQIVLLGDAAKLVGLAVYKGILQPVLGLGAALLAKIESGVKSAASTVAGWAVGVVAAVGGAILKGIIQPLADLPGRLFNALKRAISEVIQKITGWASSAAAGIGSGIAGGILHGVGDLAGKLGGTIKGAAGGALHDVGSFLGIGSPSRVWADKIGRPIAQGIIAGYLEGAANMPSQIQATVARALAAARAQVAAAQTKFKASFSSLAASVDQVLGGTVAASATAAGKQLAALLKQYASPTLSGPVSDQDTAAGKQLAALQQQHDDAARQQALTDANAQAASAQQQLASDTSSGADASTLAADQQAIVQAQQAIADAQYQIQVAALQQEAATQAQAANQQAAALKTQAAAEAKHETAMRAQRKRDADRALAALEARLGKEGATQKQAQDAIVKLLKKYGVTYHDVAAEMGRKFAKGLESSIHLTAKAAEELAKEIAKYLPHSPAEKGPLRRMPGWEPYLLGGLTPTVAKVQRALDGIGGVRSRASTGGASALASAGTVGGHAAVVPLFGEAHFHFDNYVGSKRDLEDAMVNGLSQWARRNGNAQLRAILGGT